MSETRRPLGSLAGEVNVGGGDYLRRRAGAERTPVERHTLQMYARREEAWRPLTRHRVAAFLRLLILCFVETENGLPLQSVTYKMLKKALVKKVIPWIHNHLVWTTTMERYWPITLPQFREVNAFLADHLPHVHKDDEWSAIAYFFQVVTQERRDEYMRLEEMEREAKEAVRRCLEH